MYADLSRPDDVRLMTFLMCGWPVVRAESLDGNALSNCSWVSVFALRCVQKVIVANRRRSADKLLDVLCRDDIMTCSQLENVLENLEKIHPEFHHFEDLVKALDECANRETILHIEISPLVKDHREFLNEQPRVTASGSRHVHFALEPPEIMDV